MTLVKLMESYHCGLMMNLLVTIKKVLQQEPGRFHSGGCKFSGCSRPEPFEGFNFRTSENVKFREIHMDAYYQVDSFSRKKDKLKKLRKKVSDNQTIYYDDIIVATERIGCMSSTRK